MKTKQNKTNVTPERDNTTSASEGCPEDISSHHLWIINYVERTSTSALAWAVVFLILPVTFGHTRLLNVVV